MSRSWRSIIIWAMMTLQVHLLLVAALHHHGSMGLSQSAATLQANHQVSTPALNDGLLCTACQIVRHNAVRPALTTPIPELAAATPMPRTFAISHYHLLIATAANGRAPPLA